jgi:hypothetical protein
MRFPAKVNMYKKTISSVIGGIIVAWCAIAFSVTTVTSSSCPVVGLKPLKEFLRKKDTRCFRTTKSAVAHGFTPFSSSSTKAKASSNRGGRQANSCNYVAIKSNATFFSLAQISCFKSVRAATRKHFVPLSNTGPNANPTLTPSPSVPAATPTPDLNTVKYVFQLGAAHPGSGFEGSCTADLSGARTEISISCTHNVSDVTEAHLHIAPTNDPYCILPNPGLSFTMICPLTSDQSQRVLDGNGFVAVHNGPDVAGEAAVGLIRNS